MVVMVAVAAGMSWIGLEGIIVIVIVIVIPALSPAKSKLKARLHGHHNSGRAQRRPGICPSRDRS